MTEQLVREFLQVILDPDCYVSWEGPATVQPQRKPAATASASQAIDESILAGEGLIGGHRVAVIASDFGFLAGTLGLAASQRIVSAIERATAEGLPLIGAPCSGGVRMQEGTRAFLGLARIVEAIGRHKAAGFLYVTYLRNPTAGGALIALGALGHLTFAEPGALIGFVGPRVYEITGLPRQLADVQRAENLYRHGLVDDVLEPEAFARVMRHVIAVATCQSGCQAPGTEVVPCQAADTTRDRPSAWDSIQATRRAERPRVDDLLRTACDDVVHFGGAADPRMVTALVTMHGSAFMLIGQDGRPDGRPALASAGMRQVQRALHLAGQLKLPLVTLVDTGGARVSADAEENGLAHEIAQSMAAMLSMPCPTVSVLLGQGAGGAALALMPADRVLAAKHGWLSPLSPEEVSALLYRTVDRAAEAVATLGIQSHDLQTTGMVDTIIDERPDASAEPGPFIGRLANAISAELGLVLHQPTSTAGDGRLRYRRLAS